MISVLDLKAEVPKLTMFKGRTSRAARAAGKWLVRVINAIGTPYDAVCADDRWSGWLGFPF